MAPVPAMRKRSADRRATPQEGGAGKEVGTSAAGPAAGPGRHTAVQDGRDWRGPPRQRAHPSRYRGAIGENCVKAGTRAPGRAHRGFARVMPLYASRALGKTSEPRSPTFATHRAAPASTSGGATARRRPTASSHRAPKGPPCRSDAGTRPIAGPPANADRALGRTDPQREPRRRHPLRYPGCRAPPARRTARPTLLSATESRPFSRLPNRGPGQGCTPAAPCPAPGGAATISPSPVPGPRRSRQPHGRQPQAVSRAPPTPLSRQEKSRSAFPPPEQFPAQAQALTFVDKAQIWSSGSVTFQQVQGSQVQPPHPVDVFRSQLLRASRPHCPLGSSGQFNESPPTVSRTGRSAGQPEPAGTVRRVRAVVHLTAPSAEPGP